jgi:hypothetical protein
MKRMLRTALLVLGIGIVSLALFNCDLSGVSDLLGDQRLEGRWVRGDGDHRWSFYSDRYFVEESWDGSKWNAVSDGDYAYNSSQQRLELDDQMNGWEVAYDIIMNSETDRMALGEDALTGGNSSTLLGTWVGGFTVDGVTMEVTWFFASGSISHTTFMGNTATGDVSINTEAKRFTVSDSTNTAVLANGTYNYIVIGDGITISEVGDAVVAYFDKQ